MTLKEALETIKALEARLNELQEKFNSKDRIANAALDEIIEIRNKLRELNTHE